MSLRRQIFILGLLFLLVTSGCSGQERSRTVPSDFIFVMDVRGAKSEMAGNIHVNIKIDARGNGRFEYYDSGSSISYDLNDRVTYERSQVIKSGKFKLTSAELEQLWNLLNKNRFFELEEHYEMQIGYSYAFLMVEANGKKYLVNNIGMEVPEVKAIVDGFRAILPDEINFEYGKGVKP